MAASKARAARTTSLPQSSLSDSEKMEATGGWEAIEWTKNEPHPRTVSHGFAKFLLEAEEVIIEGYGVVLVNTDEAGTLLVTNYRLLFVSEKTRDIIALGTIPLAVIEKFSKLVIKQTSGSRHSDKSSSKRLLQVFGKDMRIIVFGFRPRTKQVICNSFYRLLWKRTLPALPVYW
ncbi:hypothetical protein Cgig2_022569 [Carnegiea gigantea]|uniref:GRAM domain-containing protein n=1 Tax=Carnegiea gigantea TaxID=171969 RepID=A0A9Q1QKH5_9CARY|nr:hypothetical protein Cgig2_022569 [Carnegiea gigantea]